MALVPLAVTVEIRALDSGARLLRAFRLSRGLDEGLVRFERDLPFEPGRRVAIEYALPDDPQPISGTGVVTDVAPDDEALEGEVSRPRAVSVTALDPDGRRRLVAYLSERTRSP